MFLNKILGLKKNILEKIIYHPKIYQNHLQTYNKAKNNYLRQTIKKILAENDCSCSIGIFGSSAEKIFLPGLSSDFDYICINNKQEKQMRAVLVELNTILGKLWSVENHSSDIDFALKQNDKENSYLTLTKLKEVVYNSEAEFLRNAIMTGAFEGNDRDLLANIYAIKEQLQVKYFSQSQTKTILFPASIKNISAHPTINIRKDKNTGKSSKLFDIFALLHKIKTINLINNICSANDKHSLSATELNTIRDIYFLYLRIKDYLIIVKKLNKKNVIWYAEPAYLQLGQQLLNVQNLPVITAHHDFYISNILDRIIQ